MLAVAASYNTAPVMNENEWTHDDAVTIAFSWKYSAAA